MRELGRIKGNGDAVDMRYRLESMLASQICRAAGVDACDVNHGTYIYAANDGDGVVCEMFREAQGMYPAYPSNEFWGWGYVWKVAGVGDVRHALWTNELVA